MADKFDLNPNLLEWKTRHQTPLENDDYWPLVDTVGLLYSNLLATLIFTETPA